MIVRSTPNRSIEFQSFPLQTLFSTSFRGQPFVSKDRWPRCTLWNHFSVPLSVEKHQNSVHASCSGPLRAAKKGKNHQDFDPDGTGREQGHLRLRRSSSRSLVLIQPCAFFLLHLQLSRRPGNLFYLFTPVKTSQKSPRGVRTMGLAFEHACSPSCMQHTPACVTCMLSRSEQITGMVTSIVVLRFTRTPPPLCHS